MNSKSIFIALVGKPNVGKSSLMNLVLGEKIAIVSNKPQTTRNRITGILTKGDNQFVFLDTPGFQRPRTKLGDYMVNITNQSIADVDLTVLVVEPIPTVGAQTSPCFTMARQPRRADVRQSLLTVIRESFRTISTAIT